MQRGFILVVLFLNGSLPLAAQERDLPYRELTGRAEGFRFLRDWRSYYWREDFTFLLRTDDGKTVRVISREPTPWTDYRLGTTFTRLAVNWDQNPRVQVIGVAGVDRIPADFHDVKSLPENTVTAFLVRVEVNADGKKTWQDFFINNWFHRWGKDADVRMLPHFARKEPSYQIYGFVGSNYAPFDRAGKELLEKAERDYGGIIYHARVVKCDTPLGYELQVVHLMGRHKKTLDYQVFHGDEKQLVKLDRTPPKK